jgi:hypothetical protein
MCLAQRWHHMLASLRCLLQFHCCSVVAQQLHASGSVQYSRQLIVLVLVWLSVLAHVITDATSVQPYLRLIDVIRGKVPGRYWLNGL